jgi:hypothetical protein
MTTTYLSPEYFAFFKQFALEAKKRDMKVWIVDDIGYPSGFAGGIFAAGGNQRKDKHDLSMQASRIASASNRKAGETLNQSVSATWSPPSPLSASGEQSPFPSKRQHRLDRPAGNGDWTVLLVSHVFRTSPTRSDTNPTHAKDSTHPLEDYLNPEATAAYIEATHNGYYKAMPELFGTTILGFRGDEPDYSIAGLPWTPAFFDTSKR